IYKLLHNDTEPGDGEVLVTGATGGVASLGIAILNKIGYRVAAATGKSEQKKYLEDLGAEKIIGRDEVQDDSGKPLLSGRWAGVLDTVGGIMLDTAIRQTRHNGTVACCGNILGHELHTSIYPFILRGVSLMGIDSAHCPMSLRKEIWSLLATDWKPEILDRLADECSLEELEAEIKKILRGDQTGRILVNLK
ncbi:MAG: zinc-binding dehydrogenase, partial [Balneolaceae bacterium]|nr:zinc-binding dehydrogenase [Balneolaceae bacterium]